MLRTMNPNGEREEAARVGRGRLAHPIAVCLVGTFMPAGCSRELGTEARQQRLYFARWS